MGAGASGVSLADEHPSDVFSRGNETWNEYLDSGSNEKYWNNVVTGKSTFEKPQLVQLIEKERERDAVLFSKDEDLDEATRNVLEKADKEATQRRLAKVEKMTQESRKADKEDSSKIQMAKLAKMSKGKDQSGVEKRRELVNASVFAKDKMEEAKKARLRVEAENEVQRFIDWIEMNRPRITFEDQYGSGIPLELRFRSTLVKPAAEITVEEVKEMRKIRIDLTEEWLYDDTKILMVQCAWRGKKGKLHAHMVRQGKKLKKDWGIKEREIAEERRRERVLEKVKFDEKNAILELEEAQKKIANEGVNKVLDELRAGGTLKLVDGEVGLAFEEKARKARLVKKTVTELRGIHTTSLRHALRNGTYEKKPRGHFEKLRLAQMMMSESALRRCFYRWEERIVASLRLREAMLLALSHYFDAWKMWHKFNIKLKQKVASAIHGYYSMYVGYAFKHWWLRTRINFTLKTREHKGVSISFMERRDDFTVTSSNAVGSIKGKLVRRLYVNEWERSTENHSQWSAISTGKAEEVRGVTSTTHTDAKTRWHG